MTLLVVPNPPLPPSVVPLLLPYLLLLNTISERDKIPFVGLLMKVVNLSTIFFLLPRLPPTVFVFSFFRSRLAPFLFFVRLSLFPAFAGPLSFTLSSFHDLSPKLSLFPFLIVIAKSLTSLPDFVSAWFLLCVGAILIQKNLPLQCYAPREGHWYKKGKKVIPLDHAVFGTRQRTHILGEML